MKVFKNLDHYNRATSSIWLICLAAIIILSISGSEIEVKHLEWFLNFLPIPATIGHCLSGGTYIGRVLDTFNNFKKNKWECIITTIGITVGLILSIILSATSSVKKIINIPLFMIRSIGILGGISNRTSVSIFNQEKNKNERLSIHIMGWIGLILGVSIILTGGANALILAGIGGIPFLIPNTIALIAFAIQSVNLFQSFTDYFSKTVRCISCNEKGKKGEYIGSTLGILAGVIASIAFLCTAHIALSGILYFTFCGMASMQLCSIFGGIGSRTGRLVDGIQAQREETEKLISPSTSLTTTAVIIQASPKTLSQRSTSTASPTNSNNTTIYQSPTHSHRPTVPHHKVIAYSPSCSIL